MIPYALTNAGWAAALPRRPECGHVVCVERDDCAYQPATTTKEPTR